MSHPITGIDHTIVGVADLEAARGGWWRLGFTLTPRGRHIGWGTANYCIMFPDDYVELLGIVDASQFVNGLDRFLETGEGMLGLAFGTPDIEAVQAELAARGVPTSAPKDLSRYLELPDGDVEPAFKLVFPGQGATPDLSAFVCQHLTPELMRRPDWLAHPNGAHGLYSVTVVVEAPLAHREAYDRLLGPDAIIVTDATLVDRVGGHRIVFVAPDDVELMHPAGSLPAGAALPHALALTLRVLDAAATAQHLVRAGVSHRRLADGTVAVPAAEANGVLLEFRAV
jgi:hypothetical protein